MARACLLVLAALALPAQPALRVAFLGTSITCGAGATERFLPQVAAGLEKRFNRTVQTYDLCFGGAHSFTTLLLLKHTALPWKPDLAIVETGALDGFTPALSLPALEGIFNELAAAQVPAVFLTRRANCSDENTRPAVLRLARQYNYPVADLPALPTTDGCHPTNEGHAKIAAALLSVSTLNKPTRAIPNSNARFQPASEARREGPATEVPLTFFKQSGAALRAPQGDIEWRFQFEGTLAAVLFRLGHPPESITYRIDQHPWRQAVIQPAWFLNYYLETNLQPGPHQLTIRLRAGPAGVILDGLQTLVP